MKILTIQLMLIAAVGFAPEVMAQNNILDPSSAPVEAASEKAAEVGLLPHQKRGKPLDTKERNPFAVLVQVEPSGEAKDANSEESRIRAVLMGMKVSGVGRTSTGGMKAQLGGLFLEEGRELSQIIPNQTDILKVTKVNEKQIEITWVDLEGTEQSRTHIIELDLDPKVRTQLLAPGSEGDGGMLTPIDPRAEEKRAVKRMELTSRNESPSPAE